MTEIWTMELCREKAKEYKTRQAWNKGHNPTYTKAKRKGWLDKLCKHMSKAVVKPKLYNFERCKKDAKKYNSRQEWNKGDNGSYQAAYKKGWLDVLCTHMVPPKTALKWTLETLIEDAKSYYVRYHWKKNNGAAYGIARNKGWLDKCCTHMKDPHGQIWSKEKCIEDAKKYSYRGQWQRGSPAYKAALKNNWLEDCCQHMTAAPPKIKYTLEDLITSAKKYERIVDWQRHDNNSYSAACRRGYKEKCISHMKPAFQWTKELCMKDAASYEHRTDWKESSGGAYSAAYKNGWEVDCVKHMKPGRGTDNDALYIWEIEGIVDEFGFPVYKIGVTSQRLGKKRISWVAERNGFSSKILKTCINLV